ncbi:MAG: diacylglycerol kinase family lipid kinase [Bacteroidales bacterium]|jgi:YegS/Rv2252/BmrU family lipid kinase|nr:diacylglycerol kinase family lipid kinase [Bacteroidales bacterium]
MKKTILFIINPISGGKNKTKIIDAIPKLLDINRFDFSVIQTKYAGHASEMTKNAVEKNIDIVVAVGGDGTMNEVASSLVGSNTALAIIPCGSGNGLARDLGIPLQYKKALQQINSLNIKPIDVGVCNNKHFFSLAGVGFDAQVAYDFNRGKKRSLFGYVWAILKAFFKTQEHYYEIELENGTISDWFFFITIANCSQWGYNVKVAPEAKLDDGKLVVVLCKKPPLLSIIPFGIKVLTGKIEDSKYVIIKTSHKISINSDSEFYYHIDGDSKELTRKIDVGTHNKILTVCK